MNTFLASIDDATPEDPCDSLKTYAQHRGTVVNSVEDPQSSPLISLASDSEDRTPAVETSGRLGDSRSLLRSSRAIDLVDSAPQDNCSTSTAPNPNLRRLNASTPSCPLQERTPLIRSAGSSGLHPVDGKFDPTKSKRKAKPRNKRLHEIIPFDPTIDTRETPSVKQEPPGTSTFSQSLLNTIGVLLGMTMLSMPLAFSYAGWLCGILLLASYGFLTCYTGKILGRFIMADPTIWTYADVGQKAFGKKILYFLGPLLCLELFTSMVAFVTLSADSLETVAPTHSATSYKLFGLIVFLPIVFVPLAWLSVTSVLGIVSSILLVAVILIDGFTKETAPGSVWDPLPSNFGIASLQKLGISFGLIMSGLSTHLTIPNLIRDMEDPSQFDKMLDIAYIITTALYGVVGIAGYRMFGNDVSEEISLDLFATPGYNKLLNRIPLYTLIIIPLTKFGLTAHPLNTILERMLGLEPRTYHYSCVSDDQIRTHATIVRAGSFVQRVLVSFLIVATSIAAPGFGSIMGILGAACCFLTCIIGPVSAKIVIEKRCTKWDAILLTLGVMMASWGTSSVLYS